MSSVKEMAEGHESISECFSQWRKLVDRQVGKPGSKEVFEEEFEALPEGVRELLAKMLALAAVHKGDEAALGIALRSCPPSHKDGRGVSLSHVAAGLENPGMLITLAEAGAKLAASDLLGRTALDCAVAAGREACVAELLARGVRLPSKKASLGGWSCLHEAARRGDVGIAQRLLDAGADIDALNSGGNTALSLAAANGPVEMGRHLLERGANANLFEHFGATPLHAACENGSAACVKELLAHGVDPEARPISSRSEAWRGLWRFWRSAKRSSASFGAECCAPGERAHLSAKRSGGRLGLKRGVADCARGALGAHRFRKQISRRLGNRPAYFQQNPAK